MTKPSNDDATTAKTSPSATSGGLDGIAAAVKAHQGDQPASETTAKTKRKRGPAPVHLWNPPFCGDLDIRISADGNWHYLGTPIGRRPLVELFASVLRKDEDGKTYLVTPVEKIGITVDDAPFVAVDVEQQDGAAGPELVFETNLGDVATLGPDHPLRVETDPETEEPRPYILVRGRLEALVDRKTFYRLCELGGLHEDPGGEAVFGVTSQGAFFEIARGGSLDGLLGESDENAAPRSRERA